MPSIFTGLIRFLNFREYADSICLSRKGLNNEICRLVKERLARNELVIVLAHFTDSFTMMQNEFDESGVPYRVQADPINCDQLRSMVESIPQQSSVLTLSDMLPQDALTQIDYDKTTQVSVIVIERHPLAIRDRHVIDALRAFPFPTHVGFFLALDDAVLSPMNTDWVGSLLRQMGSTETELISSHMVSRRVRSLQRRFQNGLEAEQQANSAEAWIKLNASWCLK